MGVNASVGNYAHGLLTAGGAQGGMAHIGWGAAGGAGVGAGVGLFSDNESMFGGAFKGALAGAAGGAGSKYVSGRYAAGVERAMAADPMGYASGYKTSHFVGVKSTDWKYW
jgi:hypothetical protein